MGRRRLCAFGVFVRRGRIDVLIEYLDPRSGQSLVAISVAIALKTRVVDDWVVGESCRWLSEPAKRKGMARRDNF